MTKSERREEQANSRIRKKRLANNRKSLEVIIDARRRRLAKLIKKRSNNLSKAERILVAGTLGICTGVWTTLAYLILS